MHCPGHSLLASLKLAGKSQKNNNIFNTSYITED